ncbi:MAG: methyltransferase domain-containing protein [Planctomycetota bacterium]
MRESAKAIADTLVEKYRPKDAVDFGCGSGSILAALRERGVSVRGFDYAEGALRICREKGLDVAKFDLEAEATLPVSPVDLVISTEVAEHLPESVADRYVKLLCDASRHVIVMTAATPGQGGTDHVNEQPHAYWIEKFSANGFAHRADQTRETRQRWTELDVESNRASNVLIFTKQADSPSAT